MFRLIAPLMASLLAIHALLGCCWHHGHDEANCCQAANCHAASESGSECGTTELQAHLACGHCEADHAAGQQLADQRDLASPEASTDPIPGESDPSGDGCDDCQGVCTFVRGSSVQADALQAGTFLASPVDLPAQLKLCPAGPSRFLSHPPSLQPPVRLHLVHQVLVI